MKLSVIIIRLIFLPPNAKLKYIVNPRFSSYYRVGFIVCLEYSWFILYILKYYRLVKIDVFKSS